jgi:hypothetical protein
MAILNGTAVGAAITPNNNDTNTYATHIDLYGQGGLMVVPDFSALSSIPLPRQKIGMLVYRQDTSLYYTVTGLSTQISAGVYTALTGVTPVLSLSGSFGTSSGSGYTIGALLSTTTGSFIASGADVTFKTLSATTIYGTVIGSQQGVLSAYRFSGNGSSTSFDLSTTTPYTNPAGYIVSLNGALQTPNIDYTINYTSGTNKLSTLFVPRNGSLITASILANNVINSPTLYTTNNYTTSVNTSSFTTYLTGNLAAFYSLSSGWQSAYTWVSSNSATATFKTSVSTGTVYATKDIVATGNIYGGTNITIVNGNTYTFQLSDNGGTIASLNTAAQGSLTASVIGTSYPVGYQTCIIQLSTAQIQLSGQGITINNSSGYTKTNTQYSAATLLYTGPVAGWVVFGDLVS